MTMSRMEKYHNNKNKSFKKGIATALMGTVLVSPIALSSISASADTVPAGTQATQTEWTANSVETVRSEMQAQGLNLNDVNGDYVVRQGDTLSAISIAAHESMQQIANDNHITNLNLIYVGQLLHLRRTEEAPILTNGYVLGTSGNGTKVAQAPKTAGQMHNDALINQGVTPNASTISNNSSVIANNVNESVNGSGTVAAQPSRTAEQARNAAQVATKAPVASKTTAKATDTKKASSAVKSSTASSAKTTSSSAKASSAVSSSKATTASKSSVVSSSTANKPAQSSSSTASQTSSKPAASTSSSSQASSAASSSSKPPVTSSSTADKPAQSSSSTASQASSKPATSSSTAQSSSSQASSTAPSQSSSSQASSIDYNKGVVNSDGTVNYQAAVNQQGPWQGKDATPNAQGQSPAEQEWLKDHQGAQMEESQFADGSENQVPVYQGNQGSQCIDRPQMTQQQLNDANTAMQKNINAPETFGNGIQWVSSDYNGEVTGTMTPVNATNPEQTPYENYSDTVGRVDANIVKQDFGKQPAAPTNFTNGDMKAPDGSHYVSSNITNAGGNSGVNTNKVTLTFYK